MEHIPLIYNELPAASECTSDDAGCIKFWNKNTELMTLDKDGMTYKGKRIEDAGEAHKAFLEVMQQMRNERIP